MNRDPYRTPDPNWPEIVAELERKIKEQERLIEDYERGIGRCPSGRPHQPGYACPNLCFRCGGEIGT